LISKSMPAAVITAALAVLAIFSASIMSDKVNGIRAVEGDFRISEGHTCEGRNPGYSAPRSKMMVLRIIFAQKTRFQSALVNL
jgi:hypothetical protein